jgi:membrane protease subunit (stomatin/prohibitin family)
MLSGFIERMKTITGNRQNGQSASAVGSDERTSSATLYHCPDCSTTYIAAEMEQCAHCGGAVTEVPTAADLGMGADDIP